MATKQQVRQLQKQLDEQCQLRQSEYQQLQQHFEETVDTLRTDFQDTVSSLQDIINGFQHTIESLRTEVQSLQSAAEASDSTARVLHTEVLSLWDTAQDSSNEIHELRQQAERVPSPPSNSSSSRSSRAKPYRVNSWRPQTPVDIQYNAQATQDEHSIHKQGAGQLPLYKDELERSPQASPRNQPFVSIGALNASALPPTPPSPSTSQRALAVSAAKRWKYRLTGRCVRCGSSEHWVKDCQLLPTKPARAQGKSRVRVAAVNTVDFDGYRCPDPQEPLAQLSETQEALKKYWPELWESQWGKGRVRRGS
jgi:hypothetical protein